MNGRLQQILARLSHLSFAPIPHLTFLWPTFLWLLLLVPLAVGLYVLLLYRRKKTALRYANLAMVKAAMGAVGWRRHVPPALMLLALTLLLIAVARPTALVTLPSNRATVILAMDVSGSMRATDVNPTRLEAAQTAAKQYIKSQPKDVAIGIVAFAVTAFLVQSPTVDHAALDTAIDHFQLQRGTAVGSGILVALKNIFPTENFPIDNFSSGFGDQPRGFGGGGRFSRYGYGFGGRRLGDNSPGTGPAPPKKHVPVEPGSYKNAVMILLTDGQTNAGFDPIEAARTASEYGLRV
ncbi:MAG TPA: VWA domain-containing protein, partial [Rhizomicrobium sp.]|nr:VWA domain-containing protein [Rhizomicrobium sp.]